MNAGETSPARAGEVETRSGEGEGDRAASLYLLRADPITLTLTLGAARHRPPGQARWQALSRESGRGFLGSPRPSFLSET